jgi:hypothetical protein
MKLSEVGDARIRGYLFVLGQSLGTFLPRDVARGALQEIESHIRERLESSPSSRTTWVSSWSMGFPAASGPCSRVRRVPRSWGGTG